MSDASLHTPVSIEELKKKWHDAGQGHVFQYFDSLTSEEKDKLLRQLRSIDVGLVNKIYEHLRKGEDTSGADIKPYPFAVKLPDVDPQEVQNWERIGYEQIAAGRVAALVLAGGQGTRLGSNDPKGVYNVGLPSGKTLYQLQGERILAMQQLVAKKMSKEDVVIPWYVMTSFATDAPTREYFEKKNYFGLKKEQIIFFNQDLFPCVFEDGKIILKKKYKVSVAPNGNGGLWSALNTTGVLADMERRGIKLVCSYPVDNILVRVIDPIFVGFTFATKADVACKVVPKAYATERVGVLALKNDRPAVIEYTEVDPERAASVDPKTGQLLFNASHIVLNNFSIEFMKKIADPDNGCLPKLPYHVARKRIPYYADDGTTKTDKMGWKFELFIFDVFQFADNLQALEVKRSEEFSPLKNSEQEPSDNPITCRRHLYSLHKQWLKQAGAILTNDSEDTACEISPLVSVAGEGLESFKGKTVELPVYVESLTN